jgi:hypothetical protein
MRSFMGVRIVDADGGVKKGFGGRRKRRGVSVFRLRLGRAVLRWVKRARNDGRMWRNGCGGDGLERLRKSQRHKTSRRKTQEKRERWKKCRVISEL